MLNNATDPVQDTPEAPPPVRSSRLILWLVALGLSLLIVPLFMISTTIKETTAPLVTQLAAIQATLTITPPPNPQEAVLKSTLAGVQNQLNTLGSIHPTLVAGHIDWAAVITYIANYDQAQMTLTGVAQTGNQIVITGRAGNETVVMAYADMLRSSNQFERVVLQSIISRIAPTPTLTPTTPPSTETPAPDAVTPTPGSDTLVEFTIALDRKLNPL